MVADHILRSLAVLLCVRPLLPDWVAGAGQYICTEQPANPAQLSKPEQKLGIHHTRLVCPCTVVAWPAQRIVQT